MARNDVYIYTEAPDPTAAVVTSKTSLVEVDFPDVLLGDTPLFNFYFTDGTNWASWAGQSGYTLTAALGDAIAGDNPPLAYTDTFTTATGGWSGRLPLATAALRNDMQNKRVSQARPVTQYWLHLRVTDSSGYPTTYALIRVNVRYRAVPDSGLTSDPLLVNGPLTFVSPAPTSPTDAAKHPSFAADSFYIYFTTADNTWARAAIGDW